MKLLYLANQRLPTEKAYGLQIAAMCRAFSFLGIQVELAAPVRESIQGSDVVGYYGLPSEVKFTRVRAPSMYLHGLLGRAAFWFTQTCSAFILGWHAWRQSPDIVYCREELSALCAVLAGRRVCLELHSFSPRRMLLYAMLRRCGVRLVCITNGLAKRMYAAGFPLDRVLVAPDGVDLSLFADLPTRAEARERLHLGSQIPITLYAGHLYPWKGADVLIDAAPHIDGTVVIVGGARHHTIPNLVFMGHRPYSEIPLWLRAADVLVLPNRKDAGISEFYTSPLKMFEYMASGTPIVASDLPSIREVLNESNAVLVPPDDPKALAEGVRSLIANPGHAIELATRASQDVQRYTWIQRATRIINFLSF